MVKKGAGRILNPTDAYRKQQRKKELKKNKVTRSKVREASIKSKDADAIRQQIAQLEELEKGGDADKRIKSRKKQLNELLQKVLNRKDDDEDNDEEPDRPPNKEEYERLMNAKLGKAKTATEVESENQSKFPNPQDSIYYHPTLNPFGVPPPGAPKLYRPDAMPMPMDGIVPTGPPIPAALPPAPPPAPVPEPEPEEPEEVDPDEPTDLDDIPTPSGPPPPHVVIALAASNNKQIIPPLPPTPPPNMHLVAPPVFPRGFLPPSLMPPPFRPPGMPGMPLPGLPMMPPPYPPPPMPLAPTLGPVAPHNDSNFQPPVRPAAAAPPAVAPTPEPQPPKRLLPTISDPDVEEAAAFVPVSLRIRRPGAPQPKPKPKPAPAIGRRPVRCGHCVGHSSMLCCEKGFVCFCRVAITTTFPRAPDPSTVRKKKFAMAVLLRVAYPRFGA
eukprot:TRINITY_DN31002_c0_g1_i1.p1 TRINITY_DN31002_c0_g1~~TRINITY_DN31002_c0_g1_i1.p1  ORF type:complete len:441 (-),score=92.24 TRINITY_DN31002_c0_g1_i1:235-1557(-)